MKLRLPKFLKAALLACFSVATFATTLSSANAETYTWAGGINQEAYNSANWLKADGSPMGSGVANALNDSNANIIRFDSTVLSTKRTILINFNNLNVSGMIVEEGATGYSLWSHSDTTRTFRFRANDAGISAFSFKETFQMGSDGKPLAAMEFYADADFMIAAGKTLTVYAQKLVSSGVTRTLNINGGGTFKFYKGGNDDFAGNWAISENSTVDISDGSNTANILGTGTISLDLGSLSIGNKTLANLITVKGLANTLTSTGGTISNVLTVDVGAHLSIAGSGLTLATGLAGTGTVTVGDVLLPLVTTTLTFSGTAGSTSSIHMVNHGVVNVGAGSLSLTGVGTGAYNVAGGNLNIAGTGAVGILEAGSITMTTGSSLSFDLNGVLTSDKIILTGSLKLAADTEFKLAPSEGALQAGIYVLVAATGGVLGADGLAHAANTNFNFTGLASGARQTFAVTHTVNQIVLTVTGAAGTLKWNGGTGLWNKEATNWLNTSDSNAETAFMIQDEVSFTGAGAGTITLQGALDPIAVKVTGGIYEFVSDADPAKTGKITGTTTKLLVSGGSLTLSLANDFGGGTVLSNGTLILNADGAIGTGGITVTGGTVELNVDAAIGAGGMSMSGGILTLNTAAGFGAGTLTVQDNAALTVGLAAGSTVNRIDVSTGKTLSVGGKLIWGTTVTAANALNTGGGTISLNSGATLLVRIENGNNVILNQITGAGTLEVNTTGTNNAILNLSGVSVDTLKFTGGFGTLTGSNAFTGENLIIATGDAQLVSGNAKGGLRIGAADTLANHTIITLAGGSLFLDVEYPKLVNAIKITESSSISRWGRENAFELSGAIQLGADFSFVQIWRGVITLSGNINVKADGTKIEEQNGTLIWAEDLRNNATLKLSGQTAIKKLLVKAGTVELSGEKEKAIEEIELQAGTVKLAGTTAIGKLLVKAGTLEVAAGFSQVNPGLFELTGSATIKTSDAQTFILKTEDVGTGGDITLTRSGNGTLQLGAVDNDGNVTSKAILNLGVFNLASAANQNSQTLIKKGSILNVKTLYVNSGNSENMTARLVIDGGELNISENLQLGNWAGSNSSFSLLAGSMNAANVNFLLGYGGSSDYSTTLNIEGGEMFIRSLQDGSWGSGRKANIITHSGGTIYLGSGGIHLKTHGKEDTDWTMSGGTILATANNDVNSGANRVVIETKLTGTDSNLGAQEGFTMTWHSKLTGDRGFNVIGDGTLKLNNAANNFSGLITVKSGTLDLASAGLFTGGIKMAGGTLKLASSAALGATGSRNLEIAGEAIVNYSGATDALAFDSLTMTSGSLQLAGGSNLFTIGNLTMTGGVLTTGGATTVTSLTMNGGVLNMGGTGIVSTVTTTSLVVTGATARLQMDLMNDGLGLSNSKSNDSLSITGDLPSSFTGPIQLDLVFKGVKQGDLFTIISWTGAVLTGADLNSYFKYEAPAAATRYRSTTVALKLGDDNKSVLAEVTEGGALDLKWSGASSDWEYKKASDTAWKNGTADSDFRDLDNVFFLDIAENAAQEVILVGSLEPANIVFNNSASTSYTLIAGVAGKIIGLASILKKGDGILNLNLANDFSGGVSLEAGTLMLGDAKAIGSSVLTYKGGTLGASVDYTFAAGKLVVDSALAAYSFNVGAAANLSLTDALALKPITKDGAGRLSLQGSGDISTSITLTAGELAYNVASGTATFTTSATNIISGAGTLVKTGGGTFVLNGSVANALMTGITVEGGTFELNDIAATAGSIGTGLVTVKAGGTFLVKGGSGGDESTRVFRNNFVFMGGENDTNKAIFRVHDGWATFGADGTNTMAFTGVTEFQLGWNKTTTFRSLISGGGDFILTRHNTDSERPTARFLNQDNSFNGNLRVNLNVLVSVVGNALSTAKINLAEARLSLEAGQDGSLNGLLTFSGGTATVRGMGTSILSLNGGVSSVATATSYLQGNITFTDTENHFAGFLAGGGGGAANIASNIVISAGAVVNTTKTQLATTAITDAPLVLGATMGTATAVWNIAGTLNVLNGSMVMQNDGAATLNMQRGGIVNAKGLDVTAVADKTVTLNLDGGVLNIGESGIYARTGDNAATRVMNLAGGTLGALADWSSSIDMVLKASTSTIFNTATWDATLAIPAYTGTGTTITLTGVLSGAGALVKNDVGTLVISRQTTYTGGTTINGGTLKLTNGGGASGVLRGTVTINEGGILECALGDAFGYNGGASGVTVLRINKGGKLYQSTDNNNTIAAAVTLQGGTMEWVNYASQTTNAKFDFFNGSSLTTEVAIISSTINGIINVRRDDLQITVADGDAVDDLIINGRILGQEGGNNNLVKLGEGKLVFTANSVLAGATGDAYKNTTISAGTVQVGIGGTTGTLGKGIVTNNAHLIFNRSDDYTVLAAQAINGTGDITNNGTGLLTFLGAHSGSQLIVAKGNIQLGDGTTAATWAGAVEIADNRSLIVHSPGASTLGAISGAGTVDQRLGTLSLGDLVSFTGTVKLADATSLLAWTNGAATSVSFGEGVTLGTASAAKMSLKNITAMASGNTLNILSNIDASTLTLSAVNTYNVGDSAVLTADATDNYVGARALTKTGTGTLVLKSIASTGAGANLAMTVSGGTLQLGTVAAGTANSLDLGAAGILDIGGVGTYASVTSSTLTATAGAKIKLDFNGATGQNDILSLTGAFTGNVEFVLKNLGADAPLTAGNYLLMSAGSALTLDNFTYTLVGLSSPEGSRKQYSLQLGDSDQTKLYLYANAGVAQTLTWTGTKDRTWSIGQTGDPSNWTGATPGESNHFFNGDSVIFTEAGAGSITLSDEIKPLSISITGGAYTFEGTGIGNYATVTPTTLSITAGSLVLNNAANTATGKMSISGGASVTLGTNGTWAGNIENEGTLVLNRTGVVTLGGEASTIRSLTGTGTLKIAQALTLSADHDATSISNAIELAANATLNANGKTLTITGAITQDATARTLTLQGHAGATGGTMNLEGAITLDSLALTRTANASSTFNFKETVNVNKFLIGTGSGGNEAQAQFVVNVSSSITTGQFIGAVTGNSRYTLNLETGSSLTVEGAVSVKPMAGDATASMILAHLGYGHSNDQDNMTIFNMKTGSNLSVEKATMYYAYDGHVTWNMQGGAAKIEGLDMTNTAAKYSWLFLTGGEIMIGANGLTVNGSNAHTKIELGAGTLGAYETWTAASNANMLLNAATGTTTTFKVDGDAVEMKLAGILSGTGSLEKTGVGKLILTGANIASSKLTVSAGSVELAGDAGIWAGEVSLASASTLIFSRTNELGFTQIISGDGGIVKEGAHTLTLSGANSYTGDTSINGGTLIISAANSLGDGTTGKVLLGGATLDLAGVALAKAIETSAATSELKATTAYTGAITVKSGTLTIDNAAATNTFGAGATLTIDALASFSMKAGQTAYLVNNTVINNGTLNVGSKMYLNATGEGLLALGTGTLYVGGDEVAGSITQGSMSSAGGTIYFDLGNNLDELNLGTGSFTQTADTKTTFHFTSIPDSFVANSSILLMTAGFGSLTAADFIIEGLASTGTRQQITFVIDNGGLYLHADSGAAQTLTWNGIANGNTWKVQENLTPWTGAGDDNNQFYNNDIVNFTDAATEKNVSISGLVVPRTINVTGGEYTFTSADAVSGISGTSTLNVSGVGTVLNLASANAATGIMSVSAGGTVNLNETGAWSGNIALTDEGSTLNILTDQNLATTTLSIGIGSTANLGDGGTVGSWTGSIENNGTLAINRSDATIMSQALTGTGTLSQVGTGALTLTGDTTATGMKLSIADGKTVNLGNGGTTGSWAGTIAMGGADSNLVLNRTGNVTLKEVTGTAGTITLTTGDLQLGEASRFGDAENTIKLVLSGGSLVAVAANSSFSNALEIKESVSINNAGHTLDLSGSVTQAAGKILTLSGAGTTVFSGAASLGTVALSSGTLTLNHAGASVLFLVMSSGTTIKTGGALADTDIVKISGVTLFGKGGGQTFTIGDGTSRGSLEFEEMNPNWTSTLNVNQNVITGLFKSVTDGLITLNIAAEKSLTAKSWGNHGNIVSDSIRQIGAGSLVIQGFHATVGTQKPIDMQAGTLEFNLADDSTCAYVIQSTAGSPVFKKTGEGNLVLTNANTATQTLLVEAGSVTLGGVNGVWAGTIDLANNTSLYFNHTGDFSTTDANLLTGAGIVYKNNAGKLTLNGLSTVAQINLGAGTLDMADKAHSSDIVVASGKTAGLENAGSRTGNLNISGILSTTGNVGGKVSLLAGGQLNLGGAMTNTVSVSGEATLNNATNGSWKSLSLLAGSTLNYQIAGIGSALRVGAAQSLRIAKGTTLTGSLEMDGGTLELSLSGINEIPYKVLSLTNNGSFNVTAQGGIVKLVDVSGAIKGRNTFTLVAGMNPITKLGDLTLDLLSFDTLPVEDASLRYDGNNLVLDLTVAARLYWNGQEGSNTWDMTSENWLVDGKADQTARFETHDFVVFDGATGVSTNVVLSNDVQIGALKPTTMTVTGTNDYSFSGDGGIHATGYLLKEGSCSLSFSNTGLNQFDRGIELREGKIIIAGSAGLSGDLKIAANTNLELKSSADSTLTKLSGAGNILIDGAGVVTLKGDDQVSYTGGVTIKSGSLVNEQVIGIGAGATNKLNIEASGAVTLSGITGAHVGSLSTTDAGATVSGITGNLDLGTASFMLSTDSSTTPIVQMEAGSSLSLGTVTLDFTGIFDPTQSFSFQLTDGILAGGILTHDEYGRYTNVHFGAGAFADFSVTDIQGGSVTIKSNEVFKDFVLDENNKWAPHITQGTKAEFTAAQFKAYDAHNAAGQDFRSVTVDGVMRLLGTDAFTLNNLSGSRDLAYIGVVDGADVHIVGSPEAGKSSDYAGQLDAAKSQVTVTGNQGLGALNVGSLILDVASHLTLTGDANIVGALTLGNGSILTMTGSMTTVGGDLTLGTGSSIMGTGTLSIKAGGKLIAGDGSGIHSAIVLDLRTGTGSGSAAGELTLGSAEITVGGLKGGGIVSSVDGTLNLDVSSDQKFTGSLVGPDAAIPSSGTIAKKGRARQILAAKTDATHLYNLNVEDGTLVIEGATDGSATYYGAATVGGATPSGDSDQTLVFATNATVSSLTTLGNGHLVIGEDGKAVNVTTSGNVVFASGSRLTMYVDTVSNSGTIITTGTGAISGLDNLSDLTVVASSSWQAYVNIVLFKSDTRIDHLPTNVTLEGFNGAEVTYGNGDTSIIISGSRGRDENPYKQAMAGASQNANAGLDLIWDANVSAGEQKTNISASSNLGGVFDSLVNMGPGSAAANRLMAAVAGASVTALAGSQRDDFRQQQDWIRNRTTSMGISPDYVHEDLPYVNGWIQANGGTTRVSQDGDEAGYNMDTFGGTFGFDVDMSAKTTWGFAFTANYNKLTANAAETARGHNDAYYANLFLRTQNKRWANTFILTGGWNDATLDRTVVGSNVNYTAKGSTSGSTIGAMYETTYDYALNENKTSIFQPLLNVSFSSASMDAYTEEGAGNAGLKVEETKGTYGTIALGARLLGTVGENLFGRTSMGELRLQVAQDIGDDTNIAKVGLGGIQREVIGTKVGKTAIQVGAGISIPVNEQGSLYFDVNGEFRSKSSNVNGSIGYRINF